MSVVAWGIVSSLVALATGVSLALALALLQKSRLQALQQDVFARTEASLAEFLIFLPALQFWGLLGIIIGPGALVIMLQFGVLWGLSATVIALLLLPWLRRHLHWQRCEKISRQLPDVVQALSTALAAGLALAPAFDAICPRLSQPIRQEFIVLNRRLQFGDSLSAGLHDFYLRVPRGGVYQLFLALTLGSQHGAQQVNLLQRLAKSLRQKIYAEERLRSLSAQARLQGRVMLLLPIGLFVILQWVQPGNNELLINTRLGQMMLVCAAIMMCIGHFIVRQLVRTTPDD
ncbi:MAG TPA: type II secretion system F family protein [Pseudidiomarina sp.]|nr:type II secretion system F family protein [Pseudidiomarina sp.]